MKDDLIKFAVGVWNRQRRIATVVDDAEELVEDMSVSDDEGAQEEDGEDNGDSDEVESEEEEEEDEPPKKKRKLRGR